MNKVDTLIKKFGDTFTELQRMVESELKSILTELNTDEIRFTKETVCVEFMSDDIYTVLRGVRLVEGQLFFDTERHVNGEIDDFEETLSEFNAGSLFEILLVGIKDKSYEVSKYK